MSDKGSNDNQVCGLKWSHDDRELASGGNDNQVGNPSSNLSVNVKW